MKALVFHGPDDRCPLTHMVEQRIILDARKAKKETMKHMQMGKEAVQEIIVRSRPAGDVNS
jgi:hypothetical protein